MMLQYFSMKTSIQSLFPSFQTSWRNTLLFTVSSSLYHLVSIACKVYLSAFRFGDCGSLVKLLMSASSLLNLAQGVNNLVFTARFATHYKFWDEVWKDFNKPTAPQAAPPNPTLPTT